MKEIWSRSRKTKLEQHERPPTIQETRAKVGENMERDNYNETQKDWSRVAAKLRATSNQQGEWRRAKICK